MGEEVLNGILPVIQEIITKTPPRVSAPILQAFVSHPSMIELYETVLSNCQTINNASQNLEHMINAGLVSPGEVELYHCKYFLKFSQNTSYYGGVINALEFRVNPRDPHPGVQLILNTHLHAFNERTFFYPIQEANTALIGANKALTTLIDNWSF